MSELIRKQDALNALGEEPPVWYDGEDEIAERNQWRRDVNAIKAVPSAQPDQTRIFVELVVEYPDPELCPYKEYKGKPYYSIKYIKNGESYVGYSTYNLEVLSQYLKEYFIC